MTEEIEEDQNYSGGYLSLVSLSMDGSKILINDDPHQAMALPKGIYQNDGKRRRVLIEQLILDGCEKYDVDYVSEGTIATYANEVVSLIYERAVTAKKQKDQEAIQQDARELLAKRSSSDQGTKIITYLTNAVMNGIPVKTLLDTGDMLYYDSEGKVYRFGGERIIDIEVEKLGGYGVVTNHEKNEIRKHIQDNTGIARSAFNEANLDIINLENCRLNIITLRQRLQTPEENLTLSKFPIEYDPQAECPRIEKFLGDVVIDLYKLKELLKFWGYVLLRSSKYEKALLLLGGGSNGKSVLIKLLETAVGGDDNCSHGSLHDFEEDKFARAQLFGMVLNTYADMKSAKLRETGNIKTIISGDSIEAQHKHKPRFKLRNTAKIIVSTNNPPETDDKTHAFYRRWLIVTFDRTFASSEDPQDPNKKDTDILVKLTTREELSGFLNLGLKYLQVLIKENGFAEEPIDKVKREYEHKADHVARYLQDCCVIDFNKKDYETRTATLYNHYLRWCSERDQIIPLDENIFGSRLIEHGIQKKRKKIKGEGQPYFYTPVVLRHALHEEQGEGLDSSNFSNRNNNSSTNEEAANTILTECPYCAADNVAATRLYSGPSTCERFSSTLFLGILTKILKK